MYILDANAFIAASNVWYGLDFCPAYWNWLALAEQQGLLISIHEIRQEINKADTKEQKALLNWCHANEKIFKSKTFKLGHASVVSQWVRNSARSYFKEAMDHFMSNPDASLKPDACLIAEALARGNTTAVTYEVSEPNRQNLVKIPDVCAGLGIECIKPHEMLRREGARFIL